MGDEVNGEKKSERRRRERDDTSVGSARGVMGVC